ncbi:MAG TPA: hypothetical protein VF698_06430 [Thermoanaerobaculia bacterium]
MTAVEREDYEEHFFDCAECANDVQTTALFVDNGRAALREKATNVVSLSAWRNRLGVAAAAAAVAVAGWFVVLAPRLAPAASMIVAVDSATNSGGVQLALFNSRDGQTTYDVEAPLTLHVPVDAEAEFAATLINAKGDEVGKTKEQVRDGYLSLKVGELPAGRYKLVISRTDGNSAADYQLEVH